MLAEIPDLANNNLPADRRFTREREEHHTSISPEEAGFQAQQQQTQKSQESILALILGGRGIRVNIRISPWIP